MACVLFLLCAVTAIASPAQTFHVLARFTYFLAGSANGPLVQGLDGDFYGTTSGAGGQYGWGTVFKMTRTGVLTTLYAFCSQPGCLDGASPQAGLVLGTDGNFYGTTSGGGPYGTGCKQSFSGCGTVFKVTPAGVLTTLYSFCAQADCADGEGPAAGLVLGTDGNFYGTTVGGGILNCGSGSQHYYCGTVFMITPEGALTTLHKFVGNYMALPTKLIQGSDGNFYGVTELGGPGFNGAVFKMTPSGHVTPLHIFCPEVYPCPDGRDPVGLIQASDGNLYGTTLQGGTDDNGTAYKLTPGGSLTTLYDFSESTVGGGPQDLVEGSDRNVYGVTYWNSEVTPQDSGGIFKIAPDGTVTGVYGLLCDGPPQIPCPLGNPAPWLVQTTDGALYGAANAGTYFQGFLWPSPVIFSLCMGLGWFNEELPNYGKVGATIDILGTNLTGASSVTFNGTAAPFTLVSPTLIQATVPPGATTGYVRVMLPSGRIPSNKKFRVTPQITSFTPTDGPAGTLVTITGVSLAQTWNVTIGGVKATFTVVDDETVTATVPAGATTGSIRIAGPGGAATSAAAFTVD